ncbi:uncharacterized protein HD556DRAFT_1306037 [Suillus plorans]|uniref:Uncharacterized protein n=1 Tax=Suillus plorans TaxID=116603 RepID=A0A9P7DMQ1_9AGAM|nr:uncharacterized protein HD556DRAFT_1306037 [Suillus plorans]KAG1798588.1 hypothetical protein HD556DRAFT_1306037 [Suillus plorans]
MSGSSTSQDLPITLLPLTSQQRDEIDRVLLQASGRILKIISEDKEDTTSDLLDYMLVLIMERTLLASLETQKCFKYPKLAIPCGRLKLHLRSYVGKAVDGFYEYLKNNNMKFTGGMHRPYYAKFCWIVQSSGTGKSRLMIEPLVDKMIPIYFDDPALSSDDLNRVSQMFISDKTGKNYHEHDLGLVTRTHASGSIQCLSNLPYIALLLDLNVKPKLNVTFPEKEPNHAETDRCLRIYASGISKTTFPFSSQHPEVASQLLRGLVSWQKKVPSQTTLEALVKFGSTARLRTDLQWELQDA